MPTCAEPTCKALTCARRYCEGLTYGEPICQTLAWTKLTWRVSAPTARRSGPMVTALRKASLQLPQANQQLAHQERVARYRAGLGRGVIGDGDNA